MVLKSMVYGVSKQCYVVGVNIVTRNDLFGRALSYENGVKGTHTHTTSLRPIK